MQEDAPGKKGSVYTQAEQDTNKACMFSMPVSVGDKEVLGVGLKTLCR